MVNKIYRQSIFGHHCHIFCVLCDVAHHITHKILNNNYKANLTSEQNVGLFMYQKGRHNHPSSIVRRSNGWAHTYIYIQYIYSVQYVGYPIYYYYYGGVHLYTTIVHTSPYVQHTYYPYSHCCVCSINPLCSTSRPFSGLVKCKYYIIIVHIYMQQHCIFR